MLAIINDHTVSGTPEEIAQLFQVLNSPVAILENRPLKANQFTPFTPSLGQLYYYITSHMTVTHTKHESNDPADRLRIEGGNCFASRTDAEKAAERIVNLLNTK